MVEYKNKYLYVVHNIEEINLDPEAADFDVVISGHSHMPKIERKGKVLYFNPGSAGPRRFTLPIAIGRITLADGEFAGEIIELNV